MNNHLPTGARQRGFTLVELVVVMVIAALVMGLVATSMSRSITGAEQRQAARKMVAALRYTRTQSIIKKEENRFEVNLEERSYLAPGRKPVTLPEGIEIQLTTARSEVMDDQVGGIRFFPDGGSTGGRIDLSVNDRLYVVNVAWLTGEASLDIPE
ncbi:type II secretion system protein GspH [Marinihelvus fidelis]|uniref:Type II secretion system protein H n=1 Tax=Marinihelvus fidelis TaxID=2613842 RepID=A0A5N0T722_9GAMM|nr:GspH/FimT family pseudopilin [Marinihelvus fidelis]KAA9130773.1 type II secretion system protein GspH [Marinihelvus fidelis]